MILIEDVKSIHSILIDQFGGSQGIRDEAALEAAIARPYSGKIFTLLLRKKHPPLSKAS